MGSGGGLVGTAIAALGDRGRAQRPDERRARRELSRNMGDIASAREAFLGRVAPVGRMFDEQLGAASARLGDTDRAFQTVMNALMGASGAESKAGSPTGIGQSLLARQREQIGRGTQEGQQEILRNMAQRGLSRSGLSQRLLGQNALQGVGAQAQAETGLRMGALGGLQGFLAQQLPMQMQRFQMGGQMPFQIQDVLNQFLQAMAKAREGRSDLFNTQANRAMAQQGVFDERLHDLAMRAFGAMGGIGGGGGGGF